MEVNISNFSRIIFWEKLQLMDFVFLYPFIHVYIHCCGGYIFYSHFLQTAGVLEIYEMGRGFLFDFKSKKNAKCKNRLVIGFFTT